MVCIYKKFKTLIKLASQYAPLLNRFVPGLGDFAGLGLQVIDKGGDFINGFYYGYHSDKKPGRFKRGLTGGFKALSKDFGELSDKIELNE
jgi:hypothetical protein